MKKVNDIKNMMSVGSDKHIEIEGIFEIEKTKDGITQFLETLNYELSEKDMTQNNQSSNKDLMIFVDGRRYISDSYAAWISYKLVMSGSDIEVEENGKKTMKSLGKAQLIVSGYLEEDPYHKKPEGGFPKFWFELFNKFHHEHIWSDAVIEASGDAGKLIKYFRKQVGSKV